VQTARRSGQTEETFALIVATFAGTLEIVAVICANITRTNGKARRSRSCGPIAVKFGLTHMRLGLTGGICASTVATGEVIYATIVKIEDGLGGIKNQTGKRERGKGKGQ
jgi:hypothetical protein